jgi:hypothetical protein
MLRLADIDLFDSSADLIAQLHAQGKKVICYYRFVLKREELLRGIFCSSGTYEDWRPDASSFPASVLGAGVDGWPGEVRRER